MATSTEIRLEIINSQIEAKAEQLRQLKEELAELDRESRRLTLILIRDVADFVAEQKAKLGADIAPFHLPCSPQLVIEDMEPDTVPA